MKKITFLVIFILMFQRLTALEWRAFEMWNSKYEATTSSSLEIIYHGQYFDPPKKIIEMSEKVDRSTPENLLKSLFWAVNHLNTSAYDALFAPGEIKDQFLADPEFKWTGLALKRIIQYGDYTILELEVTYATNKTVMLWPVRKIGQDYYASEKLVGTDKTYDFLNYYYEFAPLMGQPSEPELKKIIFNESGFLCMTNFTQGNTNFLPPLIFRFQGQDFGTNTFIEKWPMKSEQNLSSPTGTLAAAVAALNQNDVERYSNLLCPDEKTNVLRWGMDYIVGKTWDQWMRESFPKEAPQKRPEVIRLDREVVYTDSAVALIYEDASCKPGQCKNVLYFRKYENNWYITRKMEDTANLFPDYLGFGKYLQVTMFPHFDPVQPNK